MIAVDWNEKFRVCFPVQPFYVFLIAVSGCVDEILAGGAIADDARTLPGQAVFHFFHCSLISRNDRSREYYRVSLVKQKFCVRFVGRAVERCKLLALGAGHQDNDFVRRVITRFFYWYDSAFFRSK